MCKKNNFSRSTHDRLKSVLDGFQVEIFTVRSPLLAVNAYVACEYHLTWFFIVTLAADHNSSSTKGPWFKKVYKQPIFNKQNVKLL